MQLQVPEKRAPFRPRDREPLPATDETELEPDAPNVEVVLAVADVVVEETAVELAPPDAAAPACGSDEPDFTRSAQPDSTSAPEASADEFGAGLAEGPETA